MINMYVMKMSQVKNPVAIFSYPSSNSPSTLRSRAVQILSATPSELIGLELQPETFKWQYKKYKQSKMSNFQVVFYKVSS